MHVFIDESGNFLIPQSGNLNLCCVGAAVIPEASYALFGIKFEKLKRKWVGKDNREIKGSSLTAPQMASVIDLAARMGVKFFTAATEMSFYTEKGLQDYRSGQADLILATPTVHVSAATAESIRNAGTVLKRLPIQLFTQSMLMTQLFDRVIRLVTLNFSLTRPRELSAFHWTIDAKNHSGRTPYEESWTQLVCGMLQAICISRPYMRIAEGDYSYHDDAFASDRPWPAHFPPENVPPGAVLAGRSDLGKIVTESMRYVSSESSPGLQLADMLTSCYRRALMGKLESPGWEPLSRIMMMGPVDVFNLIYLAPSTDSAAMPERYKHPLASIASNAAPVF